MHAGHHNTQDDASVPACRPVQAHLNCLQNRSVIRNHGVQGREAREHPDWREDSSISRLTLEQSPHARLSALARAASAHMDTFRLKWPTFAILASMCGRQAAPPLQLLLELWRSMVPSSTTASLAEACNASTGRCWRRVCCLSCFHVCANFVHTVTIANFVHTVTINVCCLATGCAACCRSVSAWLLEDYPGH